MTEIASGWQKQDKNGEFYTSWAFKKDLLPLTITADKGYVSRPNKRKTGENPNAPDWLLESFIPDPEKAKKKEQLQDPNIKANNEAIMNEDEISF